MKEGYSALTGYDICEYVSDSGAEVVFPSDKKNISMNFPMLSGEGNSQYITFIMPRYSDGVDLVSKSIRIHYENAAGYNGISIPVNVGFSDENITAGWHVPFEACSVCGMIGVQIEAYDNSYMWCSGIAYGNVNYSLLEDSERKEYIPGSELVTRGQLGDYLERASLAVNASAESARYSKEYSQLSHDYAEAAGNSAAEAGNYVNKAYEYVNKSYEYAVTAGENIETLLDLMSKCNKAQKACTDAADNANEKAALVGEAVQAAERAAESADTAASAAQAAAENANTAADNAITAGSSACSAAEYADSAAAGAQAAAENAQAAADRVGDLLQAQNVSYDNSVSGLDSDNVKTAIDELTQKIGGLAKISVESWEDVQKVVRMGLASKTFSIGDQLICSHETYGDIVWDIIGFDHDTPTDPNRTHSMTLQMHDLWNSAVVFDASEAAWYIDETTYPSGLEAGTYCFTLPSGYNDAYGGGSAFNFTLANAVPVGGQICFGWSGNTQASDCKITTYASVGALTALETVSVADGEAGTAMPALNVTAVTDNTNCVQRMCYGSNNWAESSIRQWLNTDADANTWWEAKTVFDRPADTSSAGFLKGLDPAFLSVIGEVTKTTQQSISDGYGIGTSIERFFLLSRPEIYAGAERSSDGLDGTVYPYYGAGYSDLTAPGAGADTNRIKYRNGSAANWWLRTPNSDYGRTIRSVTLEGSLRSYNAAETGFGVSPACCII